MKVAVRRGRLTKRRCVREFHPGRLSEWELGSAI